jgi:hypothetical protein
VARWPWRTNFLCQQADEICHFTELVIDFIAPDGGADIQQPRQMPLIMRSSAAFSWLTGSFGSIGLFSPVAHLADHFTIAGTKVLTAHAKWIGRYDRRGVKLQHGSVLSIRAMRALRRLDGAGDADWR